MMRATMILGWLLCAAAALGAEQKLREVRLEEQKLREVRLEEQKLREVTLKEQKLRETALKEQKLREVALKEQKLREIALKEQKLREASLAQVTVPNVFGFDQNRAAQLISGHHLRTVVRRQSTSDPSQHHKVLAQTPAAGSAVPRNSNVDITVADYHGASHGRGESVGKMKRDQYGRPLGPPPSLPRLVEVPNITGKRSSDALHILASRHLGMKITGHEPVGPGDQRRETIAHQDIAPGARVAEKTEVPVRVFKDAPVNKEVAVPRLYGLTQAQARNELNRLGLIPNLLVAPLRNSFAGGGVPGTVGKQAPEPGVLIQKPARVSFQLWGPKVRQ